MARYRYIDSVFEDDDKKPSQIAAQEQKRKKRYKHIGSIDFSVQDTSTKIEQPKQEEPKKDGFFKKAGEFVKKTYDRAKESLSKKKDVGLQIEQTEKPKPLSPQLEKAISELDNQQLKKPDTSLYDLTSGKESTSAKLTPEAEKIVREKEEAKAKEVNLINATKAMFGVGDKQLQEEYAVGLSQTYDEQTKLETGFANQKGIERDKSKYGATAAAVDIIGSQLTGYGQIISGAGKVARWRGKDGLADKLIAKGGEYYDMGVDTSEFQDGWEWKDVYNPRFYTTMIAQGIPFAYSMIPLSIVGTAGGTAIAGATGLSATGTFILSTISSGFLSANAEAAFEAGDTYDTVFQEALASGKSEDEARQIANKSANKTYGGNVAMLSITNSLQFIPYVRALTKTPGTKQATQSIKSKLLKNFMSAAGQFLSEAVEELGQYNIDLSARGKDLDVTSPEAQQTFAIGGISGLVFEAGGKVFEASSGRDVTAQVIENGQAQAEQTITEIEEELKKEIPEYNEAVDQGKSEEEKAEILKKNEKKAQEVVKKVIIEKIKEEEQLKEQSTDVEKVVEKDGKIIGYRYGEPEGREGAGTFYNVKSGIDKVPNGEIYKYQNEIKKELDFNKPLKLTDKEVLIGGKYENAPAQFLANKWEIKETDGIKMERAVAQEAVKRGYDGIIYGDNEIQDLKNVKPPEVEPVKPTKTGLEKAKPEISNQVDQDFLGVDGKFGKTYSAQVINEGKIKKPFEYNGKKYVTVSLAGSGATAKIGAVEVLPLKGNENIKQEDQSYKGTRVKYGNTEYVLGDSIELTAKQKKPKLPTLKEARKEVAKLEKKMADEKARLNKLDPNRQITSGADIEYLSEAEVDRLQELTSFIHREEVKEARLRVKEKREARKNELSNYYASQDQEAVQQAHYEVMAELEIAEAGSRIFDEDGSVTGGISSTFPDWVPSELRTRKLFDSVLQDISDINNLKFPPNSQPRKQALYEEILAEIDSRADTDSSDIIERIKNAGQKEEETIQDTKPLASGVARRKATETAKEDLTEEARILRGTRGLTSDDIMKTYPNIKLTKDVGARDIYGNKVTIPEGEALTPYELKGNKILLQDGETYIVSKNQFANIKGQSIGGKAKPFAQELVGTEETVLGQKLEIKKLPADYYLKEEDGAWKVFDSREIPGSYNHQIAFGDTKEEAKNKALKIISIDPNSPKTKYERYTLPDGKNYKEILIQAPVDKITKLDWETLPNGKLKAIDGDRVFYIEKEVDGYYVNEVNGQLGKVVRGSLGDAKEEVSKSVNKTIPGGVFKSSHWSQPNVISHLRINERTYKNKTVTFMEELQSDWAREARSKGFVDQKEIDVVNKKIEALREERNRLDIRFKELDKWLSDFIKKTSKENGDSLKANLIKNDELDKWNERNDILDRFKGIREDQDKLNYEKNELLARPKDNKLLKNWQELTVKRALIEAVNNNSKYFVWVNGDQTTARYNLSTMVDKVSWDSLNNRDVKTIDIKPKEGTNIVVDIDKEGKVVGGYSVQKEWEGKRIDEILGKGLADKIMEKDGGELSGDGLKFGGEWANNLYDKQVPNIVKKLTGADIQKINMGLPEKSQPTWNVATDEIVTKEVVTPENLKVGMQIANESRTRHTVIKVSGDGKFNAVETDFYSSMRGRWIEMEGETEAQFLDRILSNSKEYDISEPKQIQQGIELTPEVVAKIKGEELEIKTSGRKFEEVKPKPKTKPLSALASKDTAKAAEKIHNFEQRAVPKKGTDEFKLHEKVVGLIRKYAKRIGVDYLNRNTLGLFFPKTKNIHVDSLNNLSVVAHEVAHFLDDANNITTRVADDKPIVGKLKKIYQEFYPNAREEHALRLQILEGYAVLLQKYTEKPTTIKQKYPKLVKEFLVKGGKYYEPVIGDILKDLNDIIVDYQNLKPLDRVGAKVSSKGVGMDSKSFLNLKEKIITEIIDHIYPMEVLAKKAGLINTKKDPSLWIRETQAVSGIIANNISSKRGYWSFTDLQEGWQKKYDFNWKTLLDNLNARQQTDNFANWLVARREHFLYKELDVLESIKDTLKEAKKEINSLDEKTYKNFDRDIAATLRMDFAIDVKELTFKQAKKIIGDRYIGAVKQYKELDAILKKDGFGRKDVDDAYLDNKDLFSEEEKMFDALSGEDLKLLNNKEVQLLKNSDYQRMKGQEGYASFKRQFYDDLLGDLDVDATAKVGSTKVSSMIKRTGSDKTIINPIFSALHNHNEIVKKSMKQLVFNQIYDMGASATMPGLFQEVQVKASVDSKTGKVSFPQEKDPNIIMGRKNYKRVALKTNREVKAVIDDVLTHKNIDTFTQLYVGLSRTFTAGTTGYFPAFALTNLVRDQISATANSYNKFVPLYTPMKRMLDVLRKSDPESSRYFEEYLVMGGERHTLMGWQKLTPDALNSRIIGEKREINKLINRFSKGLQSTTDILALPSAKSELMTRAGEYIQSRKNGKSQVVALEEAGSVSAPFHHIGRWGGGFGKTFIKGLPFFNAATQAISQHAKAVSRSKSARVQTTFVTLAVTASFLASLLAMAKASDDQKEQYKALEPRELVDGIYFPNPTGEGLIKIPMEQTFAVPGALINMMIADRIFDTKYETMDYVDVSTSFLPDQFNPTDPVKAILGWIPQILKPSMHVIFNVKEYPKVKPLVSQSQQAKLPEYQYHAGTSEFAKYAGKVLGWSPIKIDYWLTGTFGRATELFTGKPGIYNPARGIMRDYYFTSSRQVNEYFEESDRVSKTYKSYQDGDLELSHDEAKELYRKKMINNMIDDVISDYYGIDIEKDQEKAAKARAKFFFLMEKVEDGSKPEGFSEWATARDKTRKENLKEKKKQTSMVPETKEEKKPGILSQIMDFSLVKQAYAAEGLENTNRQLTWSKDTRTKWEKFLGGVAERLEGDQPFIEKYKHIKEGITKDLLDDAQKQKYFDAMTELRVNDREWYDKNVGPKVEQRILGQKLDDMPLAQKVEDRIRAENEKKKADEIRELARLSKKEAMEKYKEVYPERIEKIKEVAPKQAENIETYTVEVDKELKDRNMDSKEALAYALATTERESGNTMLPRREGSASGFPNTEEGAIAAVTQLYERGIISRNYALPHPKTGQRYYGRGYIQLTEYDNYRIYGDAIGEDLVNNPDLALEPEIATKILAEFFKRKGIDKLVEDGDFAGARYYINRDGAGEEVKKIYEKYLKAIQ